MIDSTEKPVAFDDVRFSYRGAEVLRGVSFDIAAGEMRALVGDNGAGKSTIARIIVGEAAPQSGVARLFGSEPARFKEWRRVGYVSQLPPSAVERFPATVIELVRASQHASMPRFRPAPRRFREDALAALDRVGMLPYEKRLIRELSGGQLQRVRLACALVGNPSLLVLDEPVNGLDRESREKFYKLVRKAHMDAGIAVFLVTHDLAALPSLGCTVMRLEDGRIVENPGREPEGCSCEGHELLRASLRVPESSRRVSATEGPSSSDGSRRAAEIESGSLSATKEGGR